MDLSAALRWRYATKKFDANKVVPDAIVEALLEAGNLSATSYGLQPFQFVVVRDQELQEKLVSSSYGQTQVAEASHVIVIATRTDVDESYINEFVSMMENQCGMAAGKLDQYKNVMIGSIGSMSDENRSEWATKQAYIALGTMMAACGALEIDSCPMEGFVPAEYDDLLNLGEKNLHAAVVLPIGYRSEEDAKQHQPKVRRPLSEMTVRL